MIFAWSFILCFIFLTCRFSYITISSLVSFAKHLEISLMDKLAVKGYFQVESLTGDQIWGVSF